MTKSSFQKIIDANLSGQRVIINHILKSSPMFDAYARGINGRMIQFGDKWVADFASCNYLGFDLENEIIESIEPALKKWGVHPSWCRLVASPNLYVEAEELLAHLFGVEETLIIPTVTLISIGVIPALMGKDGVMFLDKHAHMTMYEAAKMARDSGSKLLSFEHNDFATLEQKLFEHRDNPKKLILVDGTYSMTGNYVDVLKMQNLAEKYDAYVYIDDAHGVGVVGESPTQEMPYGFKGNGVVKHFGKGYDRLIYVGGLSKAYSSLAAFVGCDKSLKEFIKAFATPYDLSGPSPTASLQSVITGLAINETRGEKIRKQLFDLTKQAIDGLRNLGFFIDNNTYFPIVSVWVGDTDLLEIASKILWDNNILITLAPYPMVKRGDETLRITITAANTKEEVDMLVAAFRKIREYMEEKKFPLRPEK